MSPRDHDGDCMVTDGQFTDAMGHGDADRPPRLGRGNDLGADSLHHWCVSRVPERGYRPARMVVTDLADETHDGTAIGTLCQRFAGREG